MDFLYDFLGLWAPPWSHMALLNCFRGTGCSTKLCELD